MAFKEDAHSKYSDYLNKGKSQYKSGKFSAALKSFDKALNYKPKSKRAWSWKGNTLRKLDRGEEALLCYDLAISLDRSHSYIHPHIGKGDIYREQKLYSLALSEYDRAISVERHPRALNGKALCLYETGKKDQAFRLAEEVIRLNPSFVFSHILAGDILFDRGSYDEALSEYNKALALVHPGSPNILTSLNRKIRHCQVNGRPKKRIQIRDIWPFNRKIQQCQMNDNPNQDETDARNTHSSSQMFDMRGEDAAMKTGDVSRFSSSAAKCDYKTAYHIACSLVDCSRNKEWQKARGKVIHLETHVSGSILDDVQKLRKNLDIYRTEQIEEIGNDFVNDAEDLKEMIHAKAME